MIFTDIILFSGGIVLLASVSFLVSRFGDEKRGISAARQAIRWITAGLVIAVVSKVYVNADIISEQFFIGVLGIVLLTGAEYLLMGVEVDEEAEE